MGSFKTDYEFGIEQEKRVYEVLKQGRRKTLQHSANPKAAWDFYSNKALYELKSRRMNSTDYDETLIEYKKIENAIKAEAEDSSMRCYYLFNFYDGVYVIKYDQGLFNSFRTETRLFSSRTDKGSYPSKRIYIPICYLRKIISWDTCQEILETPRPIAITV